MAKPTSCNMPSIDDLNHPVIRDYILNWMLRGAGSKDYKTSVYLTSFIRVTDKALAEYNFAKSCLEEYIGNSNRTSKLFACVSHLETCINSVKRCINFIDKLKSIQNQAVVDRLDRKAINSLKNDFRHIRDAVEHMDNMVFKGEIQKGEPIALSIDETGSNVSISSYTVKFNDLVLLLRRLHRISIKLSDYRETELHNN